MENRVFTLKEEHLTLMRSLCVRWNEDYKMYEGAPEIDVKRPYGNQDVYCDIAKILGWELSEASDGELIMTDEQVGEAKKIHREMETALQVVLCTLCFELGDYMQTNIYSFNSWVKLSTLTPEN